jgi:AcrR family transcriptional regulator
MEDQGLLESITPPAARRLAAVGLECFSEEGFHGTTTRTIASRAKLSPAAVYVHFPSKGDLLFSISRAGHEGALAALEEAVPQDESDPAARIESMVSAFASWHARNHRLARVLQYELNSLPKGRRAEIVAIRRRFGSLFESELRAGAEAGRLSAPDIPGATLAILSLCIDIARWYTPSGPLNPEDLGSLYAELMLRMLGVFEE